MACLQVAKHHYSVAELKHALRALDMGLITGGLTLRGHLNLCIGKVSASLRGTWINENLEGRKNGQWSKEFDLEKVRRVLPVKSLSCKEVEEKLGLSLEGFYGNILFLVLQ
ncbi:lysine-specific demethylase JMJ30-like [Primulina tabacum]|uniref:lysine-specific demethylase JMJ30-like n=1 Tax=Primulina tabacum TaxID=48773 RepID=UPI003F5A8E8E